MKIHWLIPLALPDGFNVALLIQNINFIQVFFHLLFNSVDVCSFMLFIYSQHN